MTALLTADEAARLTLGVNVIIRLGDTTDNRTLEGYRSAIQYTVAPQGWVALTGPCPNVRPRDLFPHHSCSECRDGRRIVPLYRQCPDAFRRHVPPCDTCDNTDQVLVGRGSIEVVPVTLKVCDHGQWLFMWNGQPFPIPTEPTIGRDFGVVINCVELT